MKSILNVSHIEMRWNSQKHTRATVAPMQRRDEIIKKKNPHSQIISETEEEEEEKNEKKTLAI